MAKGKDLHTLIRLAKWEVDEAQRALGALLTREQEIIDELARMAEQLKREQEVAAGDSLEAGLTFANYMEWHLQRRAAMTQMLVSVRTEIQAARDVLADAYRVQKTYELAQDARDQREKAEFERKDRIALDEIGANLHRRKMESDAG